MTSRRPDKPARYSSSAVELVECSVRVSSTLARLIRKSAQKEASGASATDALLTAAGIRPGEVATLHKKLEQVSEEAKQWREKAAREHGQLEQSKTAAAERDKERAVLRGDLRKATDTLNGAQQQILRRRRPRWCGADFQLGPAWGKRDGAFLANRWGRRETAGTA
jgi:DNA repair ATPase RecN